MKSKKVLSNKTTTNFIGN